jgi:Transposase IS66 family
VRAALPTPWEAGAAQHGEPKPHVDTTRFLPRTLPLHDRPLRREVEQWLEAGGTCGTSKTESVCRASLKLRPALWTCVPLEGVEPPNNAAERAMGPRMLWRKCSCGTQSVQGSRLVETLMTVVAPLKQ